MSPALARLQEASGVLAGPPHSMEGLSGSWALGPEQKHQNEASTWEPHSRVRDSGRPGSQRSGYRLSPDEEQGGTKVAPTGVAAETRPVWAWLSCPVRPLQGEGDWALLSDVAVCFCPPPRSYPLPHVCHSVRGPTWPPGHWPLHLVSPLCIPSQAPWLPGSGSFWPLVL